MGEQSNPYPLMRV